MFARVAVANETTALSNQILLGDLEALAQRCRRGLVEQSTRSGTRGVGCLDAVQAGADVAAALGDRPDLARWKRVQADCVMAGEFSGSRRTARCLSPERVAELRVAELRSPDALLLFLDAPSAFEAQSHGPLKVLIRDRHLSIRIEQLQQAVDRLVDRDRSRPRERRRVCTRPWTAARRDCSRRRDQHSQRKSLTSPK